MSEWTDEASRDGHRLLVMESGKVRLEVRSTKYGAWLWTLKVEILNHGWTDVMEGSARSQRVAQMAAQMAAAALKDNAAALSVAP